MVRLIGVTMRIVILIPLLLIGFALNIAAVFLLHTLPWWRIVIALLCSNAGSAINAVFLADYTERRRKRGEA
jgi:hypothetical protein